MVPSDLHLFYSTAAEVSGTLMGLLFVAISLRYDAILGKTAERHSRFVAGRAFTGLLNALSVALLALVPKINLGQAAIVVSVLCLIATFRRHRGVSEKGWNAMINLLLSVASFGTQLVAGIFLAVSPHSSAIDVLTYTLFGSIAAGVMRAWDLLQPGEND